MQQILLLTHSYEAIERDLLHATALLHPARLVAVGTGEFSLKGQCLSIFLAPRRD